MILLAKIIARSSCRDGFHNLSLRKSTSKHFPKEVNNSTSNRFCTNGSCHGKMHMKQVLTEMTRESSQSFSRIVTFATTAKKSIPSPFISNGYSPSIRLWNTSFLEHNRRTISNTPKILMQEQASFLTPEEKRQIFSKKSQELRATILGSSGEGNSTKPSFVAFLQNIQNVSATSVGLSAKTSATKTAQTSKFKDSLKVMGISFIIVLLAGQSAISGNKARKTQIKLEAALEVLDEKRLLLAAIQNEDELRKLSKVCVRQLMSRNDGMDRSSLQDFTSKRHNQPSNRSLSSWLLGTSDLKGRTDDNDDDVKFEDQNTSINNPSSSNNSSTILEEQIFQILLNHVRQVVGDKAYTDDEKDKHSMENLMQSTNSFDKDSSSSYTDKNYSNPNNDEQQNALLLEELLAKETERKQYDFSDESTVDVGDDVKVVKRRLYKI